MKKDEPAFPLGIESVNNGSWVQEGMTKREYFAAKAMTRLISGENLSANFDRGDYFEVIAQEAIRYADALLRELEK